MHTDMDDESECESIGSSQSMDEAELVASQEHTPPAGVIYCKAAVSYGPGQPLKIERVQVKPPLPAEIRIKVVSTSVCPMDLTDWLSQSQKHLYPRIFGHEAAGIVDSVGVNVTEFKKGDHVLTLFTGECDRCKTCTSGKTNLCEATPSLFQRVLHSDRTARFSMNEKPIYHHFAVSCFSEYTVVNSRAAVKINQVLCLDKNPICLLSCGVAAGLGAALKVANIEAGSTVVIFGLGIVGLSVAQGARLKKASQIIGVDKDSRKEMIAKRFGVTKFLNRTDYAKPIVKVIRDNTDGIGADYAFECAGDSKAVTEALKSCRAGWGLTVSLGFPNENPEAAVDYKLLMTGRTLKGPILGGLKPKSDLPEYVNMYLKGEIELDGYVTREIDFENINEAFQLMQEGKGLRCIIYMPRKEAVRNCDSLRF